MRIPRIAKLCGRDVRVVYRTNLVSDSGQQLLGLCDTNNSVIYLKKGMEEQQKIEVFFHECIHFIDETLLFKLGESKVNNLSVEIIRFLKDNKLARF